MHIHILFFKLHLKCSKSCRQGNLEITHALLYFPSLALGCMQKVFYNKVIDGGVEWQNISDSFVE